MSHEREIDRFRDDGCPLPPSSLPPSRGSPLLLSGRTGGAPSWGGATPATSHAPEEAPRPWQTPWISSQGWTYSCIGEDEEVVATIVVAAMSSCWQRQEGGQLMPQREWAGGGGGGCRDEAVAMLSIVGWVVYSTTKGAGRRRRRLEADERGGGLQGNRAVPKEED